MAELNEELLEDALNLISNSEASKSNKNEFPEKNQNEQLTELFDNLSENFADDILKNIANIDVSETNELIESVLGELISKEILYEPFICLKNKIEEEIKKGNLEHEKGLLQINQILSLMDASESEKNKPKQKDKLIQLVYELQENGDLWSTLVQD